MPAISVENLSKTYRKGVQALSGVSFEIEGGTVFGLLGPNGAGKSTTVRILATLTCPDGGSAEVAGCDVLAEPAKVRRHIGYVAQASGVDRWAKGRENLTLQAQLERVPSAQVRTRVADLLARFDLTDAGERLVNTYSGGMKRRLDIAMGLVHEPTVLFLDEPTTGLDPETRQALWRDLERLRRERQLTVLLTTHYLEEADQRCDRLAVIDRGAIMAEGTPDSLKRAIGAEVVVLDVGEQASGALEVLRAGDGVKRALAEDGAVSVTVANGAAAIPSILRALDGAGIAVAAMSVSRPTLDDVYLHHTGHRFEAEGWDEAGAASTAAPER